MPSDTCAELNELFGEYNRLVTEEVPLAKLPKQKELAALALLRTDMHRTHCQRCHSVGATED